MLFMLSIFNSAASKVLLGLAIILIAGFQYLFWFGEGGYHDHQKLAQKIQQQTEINTELKERNRVLAAEVYDLKNGIEAIEEHASRIWRHRPWSRRSQLPGSRPDGASWPLPG